MGLINKLGIGIVSLGLLGALETNNNGLLESRVAAAETVVSDSEPKENYTFDEVKTALGDRYAKLSDAQKKTVEDNYKKGKEHIKFSYNTSMGLIYNKRNLDSLSKEDIDEFNKFKILGLNKEVLDEYLAAFPWIKRENLAEIDKNPRNPDKIIIYYAEFCKELDKDLSGSFKGMGTVYFFSNCLESIAKGLEKAGEWYKSEQKKCEKKKK